MEIQQLTDQQQNKLFPLNKISSLNDIVERTQEMMEDLSFNKQLDYAEKNGKKIIGHFPVYIPKELIESFDMLAVSIYGGGEILEISHSEAYLGSFICSISKSTLELGLIDNIKTFDGFISPYICDVARNLAGIFERNFPGIKSHMMHYPQNLNSKGSVPYLKAEYLRLIKKFEKITESSFNPDKLRASIVRTNEILSKIKEIDTIRIEKPGLMSISEFYYLIRLRGLIPDSEYQKVLDIAFNEIKGRGERKRDFTPTIVMGPFCEQPTVEVIQLIEEVGFHIVDSDFQIGQRFFTDEISTDIEPLEALVRGYIEKSSPLPTRHNPLGRENEVLNRIDSSGAQAVIFLTAKICEPALEDFVLYKEA